MFKHVALFVVCLVKAFLIASLLLSFAFFFTSISAISRDPCVRHMDFRYWNENRIYNGKHRINHNQMVYNLWEDSLYFIYGPKWRRRVGKISRKLEYGSIYYSVKNPTCLAVNQWSSLVYVGTTNGIYLINGYTDNGYQKRPERIPLRDDIQFSIRNMFVDGHMTYQDRNVEVVYFTDSNDKLWALENGFVNAVKELEDIPVEKIVCYDDNIFFTQGRNLFRVKLGTKVIIAYKVFDEQINFLTADTTNRPHIYATIPDNYLEDYIFTVDLKKDKEQYNFKILGRVKNMTALTFDGSGWPIFTKEDRLVLVEYWGCYFNYEGDAPWY